MGMNTYAKKLNQIRTMLGVSVKMETAKLVEGTEIEAESFVAGESVSIVTEDGAVPLPVGSYDLEDGRVLVVDEEGVIGSIEEATAAEPEGEAVADEQEMAADQPTYVTKEEFDNFVNELKSIFSAVKPEPKAVKVEAAAKPVKQNPEEKQTKQENFNQHTPMTAAQRAMSKVANL